MTEATAQSYVFFIAGFETSSTTGSYALYELAQHQDIQDKVRKEIDEILEKHGELTYDAVNEMTYLHKVVNGKYIYYRTEMTIKLTSIQCRNYQIVIESTSIIVEIKLISNRY